MGIVFENMPRALDPIPGGGKLINAVDFVVNWARANSLWPLTFGTSCCAIEMMAAGASHQDWARFGVEVHRATPRQADLIILAGTIVEKMADRLITLYEQMPVPKYVIAMGSCTITGGPFIYDSYSVIKGVDRLIPVDVYIPGCPPRPEALLYGVMQLQALIKKETIRHPRPLRPLFTGPIFDPHTTSAKVWEGLEVKRQEELKPLQDQFKIDNPTYKAPVAQRKGAPKFEEVPRVPAPQIGLSNANIFQKVRQKFPDLSVSRLPEATAESLAALGPDYILDFEVSTGRYVEVVNFLKTELQCDFLLQITAVDLKDRFEVLVHLLSIDAGHKVFVRCSLPHDEHPELATLCGVFEAAEWHEREVYDFFGIKFTGHPDLRRLFLEDHFPGHPLRKDFADAARLVRRPY